MKIKLAVELIPRTCYYSNARSILSKKEWDRIRHMSYKKAGNKCEICGSNGHTQGYKNFLECHEVWEYDDVKHIQKLVGLVSLCVRCHLVKHIGRANALGKQMEVFNHLAKVNKWNNKEVVTHVANEFEIHKERSKYEWKIDLSHLIGEYGVDKKVIIEGQKKSRLIRAPWKKKRKIKRKCKHKKLKKIKRTIK